MPSTKSSRELATLLDQMSNGGSGIDQLADHAQERRRRRLSVAGDSNGGRSGSDAGRKANRQTRGPRVADLQPKQMLHARAEEIRKLKKMVHRLKKENKTLRQQLHEVRDQSTKKWPAIAFELRRRVEEAGHLTNRLKAYWQFVELEKELDELATVKALRLSEREYVHKTRQLCEQLFMRLNNTWADDRTFQMVQKLYARSQQAKRLISQIDEINEGNLDAGDSSTGLPKASYTTLVEELANELWAIEQLVGKISGVSWSDLPDAEGFKSAKRRIVHSHRMDVFALRCAVLIAKSDNRLSSAETDYLIGMGENIHVSFDEVQKLLVDTKRVEKSDFQGKYDDALVIVRDMIGCALADGLVPETERKCLLDVSAMIGVDAETVKQIFEEEKPRTPGNFPTEF